MIVDAPAEFWDWLAILADRADEGDEQARSRHDLALALLMDLYDLRTVPDRDAETATLARVREASKHPVWRVSAQTDDGAWVRLLCAFPVGTRTAVIVSSHGDLARIGDLFHRTVAGRTEAMVEHWLRDRAAGARRHARGLTRGFESGDEHIATGMAALGAAARIEALRAGMRARDAHRVADVMAVRQAMRSRERLGV